MGLQTLGSDKILRLNDFNLLGLVQSVDWAPNFGAQDIFELGQDAKVDTAMELEISGSIEVGANGGLPGLLARTIVVRDVSGAFSGYSYNPASLTTGKNAYTLTQNSLKEAQFDLSIYEKTDQTSWNRSVVLPRCFLTSMSGRVDANGVASGTLNFGGDFVVGLPSPYHEVRCLPATIGLGADAGKLILSDATVTTTNWTILYAYIDERRLRTVTTDAAYCAFDATNPKVTVTGLAISTDFKTAVGRVIVYKTASPSSTFPSIPAAFTGTATSGGASTLTDTTQAWTVNGFTNYNVTITQGTGIGQVRRIASNTATVLTVDTAWGTNPDATSKYSIYLRDTTAFAIRGYQADIYIAPANAVSPTASEQWLKVQSCDWNVDMKVEALRQIAFNTLGSSVYCRVPTYPLDLGANVSVYETDWKDWKAVLNKTFPGNDKYQDSYDLAPDNLKPTFAVVIQFKTKAGTLIQTMRFTDMRVDGYGNRVNVGGRAEISWALKGTQFTLVGFNA